MPPMTDNPTDNPIDNPIDNRTDNPTDPSGPGGADADWQHWEQTFRDARPILPQAAMARIEASLTRELSMSLAPPTRRWPRWIAYLAAATAIGGSIVSLSRYLAERPVEHDRAIVPPSILIRDMIPLEVPIGPPIATTERVNPSGPRRNRRRRSRPGPRPLKRELQPTPARSRWPPGLGA